MEDKIIIITKQKTGIAPDDVANEDHWCFPVDLTCPQCWKQDEEEVPLYSRWKEFPFYYDCDCGYTITARLHKENEEEGYFILVLAMASDGGFTPIRFHSSFSGKSKVASCNNLMTFEVGLNFQEERYDHVALYSLWRTRDGEYVYMHQSLASDEGARDFWEEFVVFGTAKELVQALLDLENQTETCNHVTTPIHRNTYHNHLMLKYAPKADKEIAAALKMLKGERVNHRTPN